jgi:hypothetical protein
MYKVSTVIKKVEKMTCPRCKKGKTLIPRYPRRSNAVRCTSCGMLGQLH